MISLVILKILTPLQKCLRMCEIWTHKLLPQALKSFPKSNKLPHLVRLHSIKVGSIPIVRRDRIKLKNDLIHLTTKNHFSSTPCHWLSTPLLRLNLFTTWDTWIAEWIWTLVHCAMPTAMKLCLSDNKLFFRSKHNNYAFSWLNLVYLIRHDYLSVKFVMQIENQKINENWF